MPLLSARSTSISPLTPQDRQELARIGATIRHARLALRLTQEDLASQCGIHVVTLRQVEAGRRNIGLVTLTRLGQVLHTTFQIPSERPEQQ